MVSVDKWEDALQSQFGIILVLHFDTNDLPYYY